MKKDLLADTGVEEKKQQLRQIQSTVKTKKQVLEASKATVDAIEKGQKQLLEEDDKLTDEILAFSNKNKSPLKRISRIIDDEAEEGEEDEDEDEEDHDQGNQGGNNTEDEEDNDQGNQGGNNNEDEGEERLNDPRQNNNNNQQQPPANANDNNNLLLQLQHIVDNSINNLNINLNKHLREQFTAADTNLRVIFDENNTALRNEFNTAIAHLDGRLNMLENRQREGITALREETRKRFSELEKPAPKSSRPRTDNVPYLGPRMFTIGSSVPAITSTSQSSLLSRNNNNRPIRNESTSETEPTFYTPMGTTPASSPSATTYQQSV